MKGLVAVARLELERRWTLLALALGVGLLPFVVLPLLDVPFGETRGVASLFAFVLAAATAALLGATTLTGDLAGGRLGFYFSRPLSWFAIWGGKLAATLGLSVAAGLVVLLPSLLFAPPWTNWPRPSVVVGVGLAVAVMGIAHWGAVISRARSVWLVLDVVTLPLVVWALRDAVERIVQQGFFFRPWGAALLFCPIALAVYAAGAAQVSLGRTSAQRSHAAARLTGWTLLALVAGGWQLVARTSFRVSGDSLDHAYLAMSSPSGDTAWFRGAEQTLAFRSIFRESFLASPRGIQPIGHTAWDTGFGFSGDATSAVWLRHARGGFELCRHDLASGEMSTVTLQPSPKGWPVLQRRVIADEEAGRVAVLQDGATGVYDTASGQRLALLDDEDGGRVEYVVFRRGRPDLVYRITPDGGLAIEELDGEQQSVGHVHPPASGTWSELHLDTTGDRLLATAPGEARLVDARTGDSVAAFGEVTLAGAQSIHLLEARPGRVIAAISNTGGEVLQTSTANDGADSLIVVDVDPLRVVRRDGGLLWRPPQGPWLSWRRDRPAGPSLLVGRLVSSEPPRSSLLRYGVETGEIEWVAGPR